MLQCKISKQLCTLCLYLCVNPIQIKCNPVLINRSLSLNSLFKTSVYISCCSCCALCFHSRPCHFLIFGHLPRTPNKSNFLLFALLGVGCNSLKSVGERHFGFSLVDSLQGPIAPSNHLGSCQLLNNIQQIIFFVLFFFRFFLSGICHHFEI